MGIATEEAVTQTDKLHRPTSTLATLTGTIVRKLKTDNINTTKNIMKYFARNIYCTYSGHCETWSTLANTNTVHSLISGGPGTDNRPNTFYFGYYGDDVEGCATACAAEWECKVG